MSLLIRIESLGMALFCAVALLASGDAVAQGQPQTAAVKWNAAAESERRPAAKAELQLDGCMTSDGLMPKLTLLHSAKIYRLEARPGLLTENPLTFANNFDALVHVTGHVGPQADVYDPDHSPVFIVNTIDKLASTCDVKLSVGQLQQLGKSKGTGGSAESPAPKQKKPAAVVDMTGELLVFEPAVLEIRAGQTVVWNNSSAREVHTVTADPRQAANADDVQLPKGAQPFDSGFMNPGSAYRYTFKKPGVYRYVCTLHEVQRMVGKIIVKP